MALDRIHGRLISDFSTPELVFAVEFLENQRAEHLAADLSMHPNFDKILHNTRAELMLRNLNEVPQSIVGAYSRLHVGFAHD